ncbi:MAG: dihydroorotate dehydrogenase-like protein [Deltaproteobacteria bacterium]|nr:dihydroorotate dehydrogenase-like protein [Deltaproteobacteria bacterium]
MADMTTTWMGQRLRSPIVCSSSPLAKELDNLKWMEDAGAGAVVLHSLFEEQIDLESVDVDRGLWAGTESYAEALDFLPEMSTYNLGPHRYLEHLRRAKACLEVPIIASLNGVSPGGWVRYARLMEEAGADALELNTYHIPTDPGVSGTDVEDGIVELVRAVKAQVRIPVAVKLSHFFSSIPHLAARLDGAGADALVMFNRFYQPDFDLETLDVVSRLSLSHPSELLLRLHWMAIVYGHVGCDLAVTGGVHGPDDVLKCMMAGANTAMMTSALLIHGIDHITRVHRDMEAWMDEHGYESVTQMQGSMSYRSVPDSAAFERQNYMRVLATWRGGGGS